MRKTLPITLSTLLMLAIGTTVAAEEPYTDTFDQSYATSDSPRIRLENINGDVTVQAWDSAEIRVYAVKKAASSELLADLEIKVRQSGDSLSVTTDYPSSRRGQNGHMSVEFTISVPRRTGIDSISLVNGSLDVVGVNGGVSAESVNGSIMGRELAGPIELETVNGSIELVAAHEVAGDTIELESVNGRVDLYLSPGTGADVEVETVNGKLRNDFDIPIHKGKYVGASMEGTIGGGGARIDIETVNGGVTIHGR